MTAPKQHDKTLQIPIKSTGISRLDKRQATNQHVVIQVPGNTCRKREDLPMFYLEETTPPFHYVF